ncbi:hypothetical protein J3Q64DRAFT_1000878 [Phycomyces blakesleeanus]|uniref:Secreted protein n=1 Tax=Phycomyces blakesleeanus TaxID=4837 RepID=A0ABR3BAM3_PHYBL
MDTVLPLAFFSNIFIILHCLACTYTTHYFWLLKKELLLSAIDKTSRWQSRPFLLFLLYPKRHDRQVAKYPYIYICLFVCLNNLNLHFRIKPL